MMGKRESKNVRSFVSLALAAVMIFGSFFDFGTAKTAFAAKKQEAVTKDGTLIMEVEQLPYDKENIELTTEGDLSGGKALKVLTDHKTKPDKTQQADIDFSFKADVAANYIVWVRNTSRPSSGDTAWVSLSGGAYNMINLEGSENKFGWTKIAALYVGEGETGSVRLVRRQRFSVVFDKFIVTKNKFFIPTDENQDTSTVTEMRLPEDEYPAPTLKPTQNEHPRLMFRQQDISKIKSNMDEEQNKASYDMWQNFLNSELDGKLPQPKSGGTNYSSSVINRIEAYALDYALNKNEQRGRKAIEAVNDYANTVVFDGDSLNYRKRGQIIFTFAEVYDWCYDILTEDERKHIISQCEVIATELDMGYPPRGQGAVCGHGGEPNLLRDLLAFGIATYDERPDIYNFVAGRILSEFTETRNYWYAANNHHQGNSYGAYRGNCEAWSNYLFYAMSGVTPFSDEQEYFAYEWLYARRPDGQSFRDGDDYHEESGAGNYWKGWYSTLFALTSVYDNDYEKRELLREDTNLASYSNQYSMMTASQVLIMNNPHNDGKPVSQLPLTKYFASPQGMMIARTGWNDGVKAPDVVALMNISELWGGNHDHLDAGNFQIYYKGILASESGDYGDGYGTAHDINYNKRSIAHNTISIYDPNEKFIMYNKEAANDGGQRIPNNGTEPAKMDAWMNGEYNRATVLAHEFGPDPIRPEYTYISGDITKAYSSSKAKEVLRSMLFMPLEDENHPAVMIVMDKVESSDASFKKSWLLHTQEEPQVDGSKTIVTRREKQYNGRMVVETLLPKSAEITKIGGEGKESWVDGKNYPSSVKYKPESDSEAKGWGRVEISPKGKNTLDYYLNVMTVSDADTQAPDLQSALIENDDIAGAVISDRVAVFAKNKERISKSLTFDIPAEGRYKVFAGGLRDGTWKTQDGTTFIVTKDGAAGYFESSGGAVTLTYVSPNNRREEIVGVIDESDDIGIRINNAFLYSDVKPVLEDGRTLLPMRAIFEALGAQVSWNEESKTAEAKIGEVTIRLTENSKAAYVNGGATELDVPAKILDGRFVVPVRFVAEASGAKVEWDRFARIVDITVSKSGASKPGVFRDGIAKIIGCTSNSVGDNDRGENSYDGDLTTVWATNGIGEAIVYEFDKEYTIESVFLRLNKATERIAYFDLEYSNDGVNFTKIGSYAANGTTETEVFTLPSSVNAKYIKYIAKGNNTSEWHAIYEIEFNVKK